MAMLDSTVLALRRPCSELEIDEAQLAAVGFPGPVWRPHARCIPA
jgi:hypothetical protein